MFLRQLEYLVSLAQERHFTRAAQHCNASQPSLSNAIKQLERELGTPIVLRHQRFQGFTAEGQRASSNGRSASSPIVTRCSRSCRSSRRIVGPAAPRRDADELADPAVHQPAVSRSSSRRADRGELPRPRGAAGEADQFRSRRRDHLYRPEAARAAGQPAALQGAPQPPRVRSRRRSRGGTGDLVRSCRDAALPALLEHA